MNELDPGMQALAVLLAVAALFALRILWYVGSVLRDLADKLDSQSLAIAKEAGLLRDVSKRDGA